MITNYKDLLVWQKSIELAIKIYNFTKDFPKTEQFNLVSQIQRSAISIPSNISEGKMRINNKEYRRFLLIAYASGAELETQLEISKRLNFGKIEKYQELESLLTEIMKILNKITYNIFNQVRK